ncbi:YbaK/EbsC family protein [Fodinibius halophilus]|uniref:YbaK/EbsC family protein n=1 Tax=Fodinibius halophilus TaxID=1736908 RepID=A0A6M1T7K2_9BACT|nr:YbaK/EbsC family protein [Fodinibius halophilus]NGP87104.1 YbaK/EbsC family protein [Fodinibius halophilus]
MSKQLSKNAQKIQTFLNKHGFDFEVIELPDSTRTANDAAQAIGCSVPQIAKSLIFKTKDTEEPILTIVSGSNRLDLTKAKSALDRAIQKADANFVRKHTGFPIGGVPPVGHKKTITTLIDEDLLQYDTIWAAAGTPHAVFQLPPEALKGLTKGTVKDIKQ